MSFATSQKPGLSGLPLHAVPAIVMDTETTGLDTKTDRVIEIAAVRIEDGTLGAEAFEALIDPGVPIPERSTTIHGIRDKDVVGKPGFAAIMSSFAEWAGPSVVIGYSLGFDLGILQAEHARNGLKWLAPRSLDVRHLAKVVAPHLPEESLEVTADWLDVEITERHRAMGDAKVAAKLFLALIPKLREKGINTLAEAERACRGLTERLGEEAQAGWHDVAGSTGPSGILELARVDSFPYRHRVADIMHSPPTVIDGARPLSRALSQMMEKRISSVFVSPRGGDSAYGILTERDILRAVNAGGAEALGTAVDDTAQYPLVTVDAEEFIYRAMTRMSAKNFRHLGVIDGSGTLVGALSARDLLKQRASDAMSLGETIEAAESPAELGRIWGDLTVVAQGLVFENVDPRNIAAIVSRELRALTRRACELAERELAAQGLGAAPQPYALMVLGSGGRGESLLAMDQDNAVIYASGAAGSDVDKWFERLGAIVADTLNDAGVIYCPGGIMAKNKEWRMDGPRWRDMVGEWISKARPEDILNSDIFFDSVSVYGTAKLADDLRRDALRAAGANKEFLRTMATRAADFQSPLGWFGRVKTEDGRVDLKKSGILPIFSAARVLALQLGIEERSTPARLEAARDHGAEKAHIVGNLLEAHRILLDAILRQQLRDIEAGIKLSNKVAVTELDAHNRQELVWALGQSANIGDLIGAAPTV